MENDLVILSDEHRFLFVHIPKTGGTSLTVLLQPHLNPEGRSSGHGWQSEYHTLGRLHDGLTHALAARYADYFKFCFVRNPYDWASSAWRNNIAKTDLDFEGYCAAVATRRSELRHAEPQSSYIQGDSGLLVDFLARYEHYERDLHTIFGRLGFPIGKVPHRINTKDNFVPYTQATADQVFAAYEEDFAVLGYARDSWRDVNASYDR